MGVPGPTQPPTTTPTGSGPTPQIGGNYTVFVVCNSLPYGQGTGQITQNGDQVSMSWTVTLNPDRDKATRDQLCWGPFISNIFPTAGSLSGTVAVVDGIPLIQLSAVGNGPCNEPQRPAPTAIRVGGLRWELPVGGCVGPGTPIRYQVSRIP